MAAAKVATMPQPTGPGLQDYLTGKIEELEFAVREKSLNLKRLEAQRNKLNGQGVLLIGSFVAATHVTEANASATELRMCSAVA